MGADRTVLDWDRVVSYFQSLARASNRITVRELGRTTEGRPFIAAWISSPDTLRRLDYYRSIQERLADPRQVDASRAEPIIAQGKAVVMITCSIHATEIGSSHTAAEFAWRLLTEDSPSVRAILDNVILLLVPSLDPDGMDLVTGWYRKTLGTPFEGTMPPHLYQKYTGHDNNRDWYIFSQQETRVAVSKLHNIWHPHIVYDVHQQGPNASRMFIPPWLDPIEPNIDPVIVQQCNLFGMAMAADLTAAGKTGVVVNALYDFWTPARHYQAYHGGLRILSESASAALASPITIDPANVPRRAFGYSPRESSWNYLEPWLGGEWRLRDIVDYQLVAWKSLLAEAAARRESLVRNFYRIGQRACSRKSPYAFVVPANQRDPGATSKLLGTLHFGLVEIERAKSEFRAGGVEYPAGSFVIRMQQPYSAFAKTLLERQHYPDLRTGPGGTPKRPYDVTAHTLPLLMGVVVDTIETPFEARLERVTQFGVPREKTDVLSAADTDSWRIVNRIWNAGGTVWRDPRGGDFHTVDRDGLKRLKRPRAGLYRSHVPSVDEGWTRWLLDEFGFAYKSAGNLDILAGGLHNRYDVLIFPDQSIREIVTGYSPGKMPEEFCGGLGEAGAEALRQFARDGGTLIFLNHSTAYARQALDPGVTSVLEGGGPEQFYSPGSLLNVELDTSSPLAYGLPSRIAIWSETSPVWKSPEGTAVARYVNRDLLASGWLLGEKYIAGATAIADLPYGAGRVILFGMRPQYRAQSYQAFKLLFNAMLRF